MPAEKALLTPFRRGRPARIGPNVWRKQVLPKAGITYRDENGERRIEFNDQMFNLITAAFSDGAFDQVPFLLDPGGPKPHDKAAVQDYRGEVTGFEVNQDGIDAVVRTTPAGTKALLENPKLGVSARIVERYDRADGKHYPVAIAHVLGTLDPKVTGMKPWEQVTDMAEPEVLTIDLTGGSYPDEKEGTVPADTDKPDTGLTEEQKAALARLPGTEEKLDKLLTLLSDEGDEGDPEDEDDLDLDDLDDLDLDDDEDDNLDPNLVPAGAEAKLSREAQAQLDLARSQQVADSERIRALEMDVREREWAAEAAGYVRAGVPAKVIELAKPIAMAETRTVDLAGTGQKFDLSKGIRDILHELEGTVDMSEEHVALPRADLAGGADDPDEQKYQQWVASSTGSAHDQRQALKELAAK